MLKKINKSSLMGFGPIKTLYPGLSLSNEDTGIGSIGRIDHPEFNGRTTISMHPHVNDEIVSYFRSGKTEHKDSEGFKEIIGGNKLMFMKAGKSFYHEEVIDGENEMMEGLQIFIRPGIKDLTPEVLFLDLEKHHSEDKWRLLASPFTTTKFQFSSQTWLYDMKLLKNSKTTLPSLYSDSLTCFLYVFKGSVKINANIFLEKKDSLIIKDEQVSIVTSEGAELVLFVTNEESEIYDKGMFSGNKAH